MGYRAGERCTSTGLFSRKRIESSKAGVGCKELGRGGDTARGIEGGLGLGFYLRSSLLLRYIERSEWGLLKGWPDGMVYYNHNGYDTCSRGPETRRSLSDCCLSVLIYEFKIKH